MDNYDDIACQECGFDGWSINKICITCRNCGHTKPTNVILKNLLKDEPKQPEGRNE